MINSFINLLQFLNNLISDNIIIFLHLMYCLCVVGSFFIGYNECKRKYKKLLQTNTEDKNNV